MGTYATQSGDFDYAFSFTNSTGEHSWAVSLTFDSTNETQWSAPSVLQNISGASGISSSISYKNGTLILGDPQNEQVEIYESFVDNLGFFTSGFRQVNRSIPFGVDGTSGFGASVLALPDAALVGAPFTSPSSAGSGAGAIFLFSEITPGGNGATGNTSWGQAGFVTGQSTSGCFGSSFAVRYNNSNPIVGIGATGEASGSGQSHIYNGTTLEAIQTLTPTGNNVSGFGKSQGFSIVNNLAYLAIGLNDGGTGKVNIYKESSAGSNSYAFYQQLSGQSPAAGDNYGADIYGLNQALMVGSPNEAGGGKAYYYEFNNDSGIFGESQAFVAASVGAGDRFGKSLKFTTGYAVIGSDNKSGSAYIYKRQNSQWVEESQISGSLSTISGSFAGGTEGADSIVIDNQRIIIGTEGEKDTYVFTTGIVDRDDYTGISFSGENNKIYDSEGNFLYGVGPDSSFTVSGGVFTGGYFSMFINGNLCRARSPRAAGVGRTGALNDWSVTNMSGMSYYYLSILN